MKKRAFKLIICICVISCLMVGFCTSFASADVVGGAGLLGSALGSIGVDLLAGGSATFAALAPWLNSDFSIRGALTGVADGFIKVTEDSVFIDGVEYQSIFLDPHMATELHIQAFDFITNKAIISNSSGILASGAGYVGDVPIYSLNGQNRTQTYISDAYGSTVNCDLYNVTLTNVSNESFRATFYYNSGSSAGQSIGGTNNKAKPYQGSFFRVVNQDYGTVYINNSPGNPQSIGSLYFNRAGLTYDQNPFTYDYVSGVIDATPLPSNYGFSAYLPKADLVAGNVVAGTYYNNDSAQLEIINKLIDLLDTAYGNEQIKNAEFVEEVVPPVPPTYDTIADTSYGDLHSELTDIKNAQAHAGSALDSIDSGIDTIGRTVDHLDETVTDIEGYIQSGTSDIVDSVDTAGQAVVDGLSGVEGAIDTYGQSVVSGLDSVETAIDTAGQSVVDSVDAQTQALEQSIADVADKVESLDTTVDQVIEKVESHPLDLFGAFLDRLTQIPVIKDLFDGIKQHVGIWHYVVEWLQCIGTFLAFFIGLFSDVAYCMVVPIYACVAGAICLAFYKRFGR